MQYSLNGASHPNNDNAFNPNIDYGDVPDNMDEAAMRQYLMQESNLVMPKKNKDSFDAVYSEERQKLNSNMSQDSNRFVVVNEPSAANVLAGREATTSTVSRASTQISTISDVSKDVDRMNTVMFVANSTNRMDKQHSFAKHSVRPDYHYQVQKQPTMPTIKQSPQNQAGSPLDDEENEHIGFVPPAPPASFTSGLTKVVVKQQNKSSQSGKSSPTGIVQSRNEDGKMVVQQVPYSKRTHMMVNIYVEIHPEHVEHIIVHFLKTYTVQQLLDLLRNKTNNGAFSGMTLEIYCADDDGDLDDDFPPPNLNSVIKELNMEHFYIKIQNADDDERETVRRSTIRHKQGLQSTETVHSELGSVDEDYEDSDDEANTGCKCSIM